MEFKKYKMAMRNRISPKNRDFVIDRERAPFDDNVSGLGEQPVFSQNEFTTTPMIDPAEFPARKEYMQSYAVGGNVRQLFGGGTLPKNVQEFLIETFPDLELKFNKGLPKYGLLTNNKNYNRVLQAANNKLKNPNYVFSPDFESLKYDKNFGTAKQLLEKARSKGIYVNEKTRTDIFARNFNIKSKPNPYSSNNPPHLIYDLSSLDDPKKTEQIIKKQIQSGSYTSETGEKYLSQEEQARKKRETSAKRTEAIKEYSVPSVERGYRGTKDVNLSHMDDIFNQYTTGYTLGYAPGKINKEFLTTYDNKIKALYEKRKKLNKQKPKGYLKELEKINEKGAKLAGETSGYKSFLFEDPYSQKTYQFGIDYSKTLDPTGILQGRRLQDVVIQGNPLDPNSKLVLDLSPEESFIFEKNRKEVLKSQSKINPTKKIEEIETSNKKIVKDVEDNFLGIIGCANSNALQPRNKITRVESSVGGRIGFANGPKPGNSCIEKGKKKLEEGRIGKSELNAVEKSLTESGKMTPAAQKFFTTAKTALRTGARIPTELISIGFGPAGVVAGALLELATVQDSIMRGDLKRAWRETFPGMILKGAENLVGVDLTGSIRTDIIKYAKTPEEIAAINSILNYSEDVDKYNEMLGDLDLIGGDILANEQLQEPEADLMTSSSSQQFYDVEDRAKKLNELLDFQEKIATSPEVQKFGMKALSRQLEDKFKIAQEFYPDLTFEEFLKGESGEVFFGEGPPQYNKVVAPNIIDPETEFMRQPFAGGGLSIQDKIQELLASIPGLMIADFVPVSEKVQLKRLFDQFNDRYMRKAEGGRIGFKNGPEDINKSRRLFNQLLLGLAALPVVGKYLKLGRGAGKVANVNIPNVPGMPEFFQPLVNKVINEGIDLTTKLGTQERQIVRKADIAGHEVTVYHQLENGETDVYINGMKTLYQDAVRLHYKPGQVSEEASKASGKIVKEPDEFIAQESSPAYSGSPEDYEITSDGTFETNNFNELASDLSEVEAAVLKQPVSELQKRKKLERLKYYESKEGQQKLLDEQYGEYDDTMRDDIIDE
jgi:hypothetical protein